MLITILNSELQGQVKVTKKSISDSLTATISITSGKLVESGGVSGQTSKTCVNDAVTLWNIAQDKVTQANTINIAKTEIKSMETTSITIKELRMRRSLVKLLGFLKFANKMTTSCLRMTKVPIFAIYR